jgi:hypothetical protein
VAKTTGHVGNPAITKNERFELNLSNKSIDTKSWSAQSHGSNVQKSLGRRSAPLQAANNSGFVFYTSF